MKTPTRVRLVAVSGALPYAIRTSTEIESMITRGGGYIPRPGVIQSMSGIRSRRVAAEHEQCSDLAVAAARQVLDRAGLAADEIDLLVFASAGQDLVEPATAHIIQSKLGTHCPVFDIKNACNSFLNAMEVAESMILGGRYRHVLVTVGEVSSRGICWKSGNLSEFKRNLPGYTMGDAGAAALFAPAENNRGIFFHRFSSASDHWHLTTVPGGGSMHPRGDEFSYLRADSSRLRQVFSTMGKPFLRQALEDAGLGIADFQRIFVHQVSLPFLTETLKDGQIPEHLVEKTIVEFGNMAAASIPVAMAQAIDRSAVGAGDRVMCLGLGSGISIGIAMIDL